MTLEALAPLVTALLVGLLIGLDRERAEARKQRKLFAGIRTFPLIALAGALPMLLLDRTGPWLLVASFAAVAAVTLLSYRRAVPGNPGATTEIAALATFLLGALAGAGQLALAAAAGVAVSVLLAAKPPLETFSRTLTRAEVIAILQLAVITLVVLPVLPNRGYGPWEVLNPRAIWLVVVLVSALSLCGFVAMRLFGPRRGTLAAGAIGGLVSSTAVTLAMAERARSTPGVAAAAAAATVVAAAIMCVRVLLVTAAVRPLLVGTLAPALGAMAATGLVTAALLARRDGGTPGAARLRNPFSLASALVFGAVYATVLVIARAAQEHLGSAGLYATAVVSALVDVDAPTVAFARLTVAPGTAATAITLAAVTNTAVKGALAVVLGPARFRGLAAAALGAMCCAGIAVALATQGG